MKDLTKIIDERNKISEEIAVLKFVKDLMNSLPDDTALKVNAFYEKWIKENK